MIGTSIGVFFGLPSMAVSIDFPMQAISHPGGGTEVAPPLEIWMNLVGCNSESKGPQLANRNEVNKKWKLNGTDSYWYLDGSVGLQLHELGFMIHGDFKCGHFFEKPVWN